MLKIAWLGERYFADDLAQCGWDAPLVYKPGADEVIEWHGLAAKLGMEPDLLVVAEGAPVIPAIETFPCATILYSVESHLHEWHFAYAQGFDAVLVSLSGHMENFQGPYLSRERIWWSPPYASAPTEVSASEPGSFLVKARENARLKKFVAALQLELPQLFHSPQTGLAKTGNIALMHPLHGELEFGVFDAMLASSCVVTPRIGHSLENMFVDGEHYVGYVPYDAGDAAYRIRFLTEHPDLRREIGENAANEVRLNHGSRNRAEALSDHIYELAQDDLRTLAQSRIDRVAAIDTDILTDLYGEMAHAHVGPLGEALGQAANRSRKR